MSETQQKALELLQKELGVSKKELTNEAKLADLVSDSLQLFELLLAFEREFDHMVSYEEVASIETVGEVLAYVEHIAKLKIKT